MKNILLYFFFILFGSTVDAQTIFTDTFSYFYPDTTITGSSYLFDLSPTVDRSGAVALTANSGVGDSLLANSPLAFGGNTVYFDGVDDRYSAADPTSFNIGTGDFTVEVIFSSSGTSGQALITKRGGGSQGFILETNSNTASGRVGDGTDFLDFSNTPGSSPVTTFAKLHYIWRGASDALTIYYQGDSSDTDIGTNIDDLGIGGDLHIGKNGTTNKPFKGYIASIRFMKRAISYKEIQEAGIIPSNWVSTHGNVTRNLSTPDFFITAYSDTLCVPLPDATLGNNQEWVFTLSNRDTVSAWIGSRSASKSVVKSIPGGSSFGSTTAYFGDGFSLSGDSLVIVFPADTASVDNVILKKKTHHLYFQGYNNAQNRIYPQY